MGKEEVSQLSQGASSQATQPSQLLAKGQPVESVGLLSTPSLAFFSPVPCLGPSLGLAVVEFRQQSCGQGQLGSGTA